MSADTAIHRLVTQHTVAAALQLARLEAVADPEAGWSADLDAGVVTLGDRAFTAELLGTHTTADSSFLWGWDHPSVPLGRDGLANRVRTEGLRQGASALAEPNPSDLVVGPMEAAVLGIGLAGGDIWLLAPADAATAVFLVRDEDLAEEPHSLVAFPRCLIDLLEALEVDAREAIEAFAAAPLAPFDAAADGDDAFVVRRGADEARIELDDLGRVAGVALRLGGAPPPPKRRRFRLRR